MVSRISSSWCFPRFDWRQPCNAILKLAGQQMRLAVPRLLSHDERVLADVVPADDLVRQLDEEKAIAMKLEQMRRSYRGHLVKHGHHVQAGAPAIQALDVGTHRRPDRSRTGF